MTALPVRWTRPALRQLDDAAAYLTERSPSAARALVSRIRSAVSALRASPALGRPGRILGTRERVVTDTAYLVAYRVRDDSVEILAVFHGARRWPDGF